MTARVGKTSKNQRWRHYIVQFMKVFQWVSKIYEGLFFLTDYLPKVKLKGDL